MKVIILCGGKGQRMQSGQDYPKPMAQVHGKPLIYHIMKNYLKYGFKDFILPLGYKGNVIRQYFIDYELNNCHIVKEAPSNKISVLGDCDNFKITMIDTGIDTMTGGRVRRVSKYIDGDTFMVTYGDGLSDININKLLEFHKEKGKIATLTGIMKKSQYGVLKIEDDIAKSFNEKSAEDGIINGGFFVFNTKFLDFLGDDDSCILEQEPLNALIEDGELAVYMHDGLWISVDTQKDLETANKVWGDSYDI